MDQTDKQDIQASEAELELFELSTDDLNKVAGGPMIANW